MELRTILYVNASHLNGLYFLSIIKKPLKLKDVLDNMLFFLSERKNLVNVYEFGMNAYIVNQIGTVRAIMNVLPLFRGRYHEQK